MDELSKERGLPPQLLNLIPDDMHWKKVREAGDRGGRSSTAGAVFGADAEKDEELELKLGLPGVVREESCSALSLGCFPAHSRLAKSGFFDTVEANPEGTTQGKLIEKKYVVFIFGVRLSRCSSFFIHIFPSAF